MRMWPGPDRVAWPALLREPLLHFAVLGAVVFAVYRVFEPPRAELITVTESRLVSMERRFERTTGRAPTAAELDGLVQSWVDEEILVRQARSLGLDEADPVVRRRLLQKMEWLVDAAQNNAPQENDEAADAKVMEQMRARYDVVIERP